MRSGAMLESRMEEIEMTKQTHRMPGTAETALNNATAAFEEIERIADAFGALLLSGDRLAESVAELAAQQKNDRRNAA